MKYFVPILFFLFVSCEQSPEPLPILGKPVYSESDTIFPTISNFSFVDQDSQIVTNQTFVNKIYVTNFIFLSCPTICPKMTAEMHNVYIAFETDERVALISHTIDPEHDSIPKLYNYAKNLGIRNSKWHFVTGNQDSIRNLAESSYFSSAFPDSTAPGGFTHSGGLLLIDKKRHIRGVYDGTNPEETNRLIKDIKTLLKEQF